MRPVLFCYHRHWTCSRPVACTWLASARSIIVVAISPLVLARLESFKPKTKLSRARVQQTNQAASTQATLKWARFEPPQQAVSAWEGRGGQRGRNRKASPRKSFAPSPPWPFSKLASASFYLWNRSHLPYSHSGPGFHRSLHIHVS